MDPKEACTKSNCVFEIKIDLTLVGNGMDPKEACTKSNCVFEIKIDLTLVGNGRQGLEQSSKITQAEHIGPNFFSRRK